MKNCQRNITKFWKKSATLTKKFDSKPVYNGKYLKTKIKSYNGKINTNFHNNKIAKESSQFIYLTLILVDYVYKTSNNYYPQVILE